MLWHILKYYICFTVTAFFRRLQVKGAEHIRVKGPVIIAMNHPNAFMDPVAFTIAAYPPRVMYLARGDVFRPGLVSALLESIGIVPIYRIQDGGKEGLKKNDETYRRVNSLLNRNQKIIIFAEGLCIQERRLRPLKKGVPRMVFGAMKELDHPNLTVVPVGVNYSNAKNFRGNLFINIGEPLRVADYMPAYDKAPAKTMNQLLQDLEPKMRSLIVHINNRANDRLVEHIEEICKRDWCKAKGLQYKNLEHDLLVSQEITAIVNTASDKAPEQIEQLKKHTNKYFNKLKKLKLRDWLLKNGTKTHPLYVAARILLLLCGLPLYFAGIIGNYIPYALSYRITNKIVKHVEFHSAINLGIGSFLFLLWYLAQFFIVYAFSPHIGWPLLYVLVALFSGWFCLYYSPFRKKTMGLYRAMKLKKNEPGLWKELGAERAEIIALFERLA